MNARPQEKPHRLPPECYRGQVAVAFTACLLEGQTGLNRASVVSPFVKFLGRVGTKHACLVLIYCFMPDHLHVIVHGREDLSDTRQAMVDFKQLSGFWFRSVKSPLRWQKDFYDHIIRKEQDLGAQVRYVAANPVRRKLAQDWRHYPHTGSIGVDLETAISNSLTL